VTAQKQGKFERRFLPKDFIPKKQATCAKLVPMRTQALCHPLTRNADEVDEHKMLALLHLQVTNTIQKSSCSSRALPLSKMFVLCLYYFVRNCLLPFCSYIFKTNEATARTMLKQAEVQPRPNEYPQTLLIATLLPSVKTDIDTSKRIAEKRKIL